MLLSGAGEGNSHCSPGDFLTVFSLSTCPGEFLAVDQTCPGEFLSVVFVNVSLISIYKFHVAFPLFLQNKIFLKSILYYCFLIHS